MHISGSGVRIAALATPKGMKAAKRLPIGWKEIALTRANETTCSGTQKRCCPTRPLSLPLCCLCQDWDWMDLAGLDGREEGQPRNCLQKMVKSPHYEILANPRLPIFSTSVTQNNETSCKQTQPLGYIHDPQIMRRLYKVGPSL